MASETVKYVYPTYEVCLALENENLSYKEMVGRLESRVTVGNLRYLFCKYKIHHKTVKERIRNEVIGSDKSIAYLSRKLKCSRATISNIRKESK